MHTKRFGILLVLAESDDNAVIFGSAAVGATLGLSAALAIANPASARASEHSRVGSAGERSRVRLIANGPLVLGLLQRRPGAYPLLRVVF